MTLTSGDRDTVHLFTVDLTEDDLWGFVTADPETGDFPLKDALGVATLDETQVEGAVAEDLDGIGLSGFLTEGLGVDETSIAPDRGRVDALTGSVVIVRGAAFDGAKIPLAPTPPLRHFATWRMTPANTTMEALESDAATGIVTPPPQPAPAAPRQTRSKARLILAVGLLLLILITIGLLA
jgi:hypothetical protein